MCFSDSSAGKRDAPLVVTRDMPSMTEILRRSGWIQLVHSVAMIILAKTQTEGQEGPEKRAFLTLELCALLAPYTPHLALFLLRSTLSSIERTIYHELSF